ncbi:thioredoxin [Mobilisporobacter senegalensis]|uniref:Thioredoxin n=1 Tax=Mobilisporobacter senegalensis TaxID=1329262 RepID=A0A3N1XNP7_9FIRM|nr:thioredoxin [Mobilisporobacter senegalensis]
MAVRVNESNFEEEVLKTQELVLVDFYSDSCIPCKQISPILGELEEQYKSQIKIVKVNVNFDESIASNYKVMVSPTIVFIKEGREINRTRGFTKREELKEIINKII